jgi:hypothetical protein
LGQDDAGSTEGGNAAAYELVETEGCMTESTPEREPPIRGSVGFSGTRAGMTAQQKERLEFKLRELRRLDFHWFHHGDCTGADAEAHDIAKTLGYKIAIHPPNEPFLRALKKGEVTDSL